MLTTMTRRLGVSHKSIVLNTNSTRWCTAALLVSLHSISSVQSLYSSAKPFVLRSSTRSLPNPARHLDNPALTVCRGGDSFSSSSSLLACATSTHLYSTTAETSTPETTAATESSTATTMSTATKLDALRSRMTELDLDVWIAGNDDPHLSEYVPEAYMRRSFLSGFRGSAGTAVITQSQALLWTDSRYWNEANMILDAEHWTLMKQGMLETPSITKWLATEATKRYQDGKALKVGVDPLCQAASFQNDLQEALKDAAKDEIGDEDLVIGTLETSNGNIIDPVWGDARPAVPTSPFRVHPMEYAGVSIADKIAAIRKDMAEKKATMAVYPSLDDIMYLLNLRCQGDVECNPVGISYAVVTLDSIILYCDPKKIEAADVRKHLAEVTIKPYEDVLLDIEAHAQASKTNKVWMEKARCNLALVSIVPAKQLLDKQNAVVPMKACKNDAELEGMRKAHVVDGAAMARFMAWLEDTVQTRSVSEVEVDLVLTGERAKQPGFMEVSFPTIAGVGPNGAIIHYRAADNEIMRYLDEENPILIDSGGQYLYGTTDVTRTWHFGTPTAEFKDAYTRVLKGHIGMDEMIFPENTPGFVLDVYARRWLWDAGLDYGHGTGHGVGAALNVHEGPMSISPRWANKEGLKDGMVVSNEPGFYKDGHFGCRIENLLAIQYVSESSETADKKFLKFEKLTMIPIQKNLIDLNLMTTRELDWLDEYHQTVFDKVSPLLEAGSRGLEWLTKSCEKMERPSQS